jgi:hypothetical protein
VVPKNSKQWVAPSLPGEKASQEGCVIYASYVKTMIYQEVQPRQLLKILGNRKPLLLSESTTADKQQYMKDYGGTTSERLSLPDNNAAATMKGAKMILHLKKKHGRNITGHTRSLHTKAEV